MTIPVPADTDLMADSAYWIRRFAEYVEGRVTASQAIWVFDSGVVTVDSNSAWTTALGGGLKSITGAVFTSVYEYMSNYDSLYQPVMIRDTSVSNKLSIICYDAPAGTRKYPTGHRQVRINGMVWGPAPVSAGDPAVTPAVNPGDFFPAGVTAHGIHYPGTADAQYKTAEYIQTMADDIGVALGGIPLGMTLAMWVGNINTDANGFGGIYLDAAAISRVRGFVALPIDATGAYKQARMYMAYIPLDGNADPSYYRRCQVGIYNNQPYDGTVSRYSNPVRNAAVGTCILAWGDPPV